MSSVELQVITAISDMNNKSIPCHITSIAIQTGLNQLTLYLAILHLEESKLIVKKLDMQEIVYKTTPLGQYYILKKTGGK
jgi:hypothetical protein